jgi:hypothetical protein
MCIFMAGRLLVCVKSPARLSAACFVVVFWTSTATATLVNPLPGSFGPDDGSQIFLPNSNVFTAEILDVPGSFTVSGFGFFFVSDPGTLVPIFGPEDQGAAFSQLALVDFSLGQVFDLDTPALQSTFTGGGPIGFFFSFVPPGGTPLTLFSIPGLNDAGRDAVATFPSLTFPMTYLIGFEAPPPPEGVPLAFEIASGIEPVGEPGAVILLALGMGVIARFRKRL